LSNWKEETNPVNETFNKVKSMTLEMNELVDLIRVYTRERLTIIEPLFEIEAPLIAFKQQRLLNSAVARISPRHSDSPQAYVTISGSVLSGQNVESSYVYDMVEYGFNIHDAITRNLTGNQVEFSLFNWSDRINALELTDLNWPIRVAFPVDVNSEYELVHEQYMALNPVRASDKLKREIIIDKN
jgi:hypothetical protein